MIKVLFFAQLREQLACDQLALDDQSVQSVEEVRKKIIALYPEWEAYLTNKKLLVAVNQTITSHDATVVSGDEVAFFPPVTGG